MTKPIAIIGARLFDPAAALDEIGDALLKDGEIAALGKDIFKDGTPSDAKLIRAEGDLLTSGAMDMQAHVGEPGAEYRETIESISDAAIAGGVTDILLMPDTDPPIDDPALIEFLHRRGERAEARIHASGALTKGLRGEALSEMALLKKAGAVGFCDGAGTIANPLVMRRAMSYAADLDAPVLHQPQDPHLAADGVMHEGWQSSRLGLSGIAWAAEVSTLARDIALAEMTGARLHALQISSRHAIPLIRRAKDAGLGVSCGVSINHLFFNEEAVGEYKTFMKLLPPLREEEDRAALLDALADGVIDAVVSGHNPQNEETKRLPFAEAAYGSVGIETLLPALLTLHAEGVIPLARAIDAVTDAPRRILGLGRKPLAVGGVADVTLSALGEDWALDAARLRSKCQNAALDGHGFRAAARLTVIGGRIVFQRKLPVSGVLS